MQTGDGLLGRITPLRLLSPAVAYGLADAARRFGNGTLEVTAKGAIQVRGLQAETVPDFAAVLTDLGLGDQSAPLVTLDPFGVLWPDAAFDTAALAEALKLRWAHQASGLLAPKFSVSMDGSGAGWMQGMHGDLHIEADIEGRIWIALAKDRWLGWGSPGLILDTLIALMQAVAAWGPEGRGADLMGTPDFGLIGSGDPVLPKQPECFGQHTLKDGLTAVGFAPAFGAFDADKLARLADMPGLVGLRPGPGRMLYAVCQSTPSSSSDLIRVSFHTQRSATDPRVKPEDDGFSIENVVKAPDFITSADDPRRSLVACSGAPVCASAHKPTRAQADDLLAAAGPLLDGSLTLHISGCAKGCAHPTAADLTLVGQPNDWGVIVGGKASGAPDAALPSDGIANGLSILSAQRLGSETAGQMMARLGAPGVAAALSAQSYVYEKDGAAIYRQSFAIIRAEADLSRFSEAEADVAVRMIHGCGLVEAAQHIAFSPDLVTAAVTALQAGAPILCDANMVAHGVTRARLPADNEVICTLRDPQTPGIATRIGNTRSAAALDLWADRLAGSVVAIGNAPTALFYLLELLAAGAPRPAAIIGCPVGFVGAAESKAALEVFTPSVPWLTVRGRMGGSAMTASAINALAGITL
jgi:precorrin-8X/cobalt-precorrin-8 methylmutase